MSENKLTFQIATDFLTRISLKLEWLFKMAIEACVQSHPTIHRHALTNLIEMMEILDKPELKSRYLKELVRLEHVLMRSTKAEDLALLDQLATQLHTLNHVPGSFSDLLQNQPFLKSVRQIHFPSSQDCEYNSPQMLIWLNRSAAQRQQELKEWLGLLQDLEGTVNIYLSVLRHESLFVPVSACHGFYHHPLSQSSHCHLLQLRMSNELNFVPKLQLTHNGLTIRLHKLHAPDEIIHSSVDMEIAVSEV